MKDNCGFLRCICAVLVLCLMGATAFAQDRSRTYYNNHESEILPDARAAFKNGDYERAVELCKLHYIVLGDSRADDLREKAEKCVKLTIEMEALATAGQEALARQKALAILALNPDDKRAKELSTYDPTRGKENGHEWVDLGLSVKWATCNVGASSPEDYGDYYAWGETSTKDDYSWETLKFRVRGDSGENVTFPLTGENVTFSKYNTESERGSVDNKTRLDLSDDAARQNWAGGWRTPTKAEWEELYSKCTWIWTTQGGKNGYKVTGKNGNSIFLPAAGYTYDSSLGGDGSRGYYWSSSLDTDVPRRAWYMYFSPMDHYMSYYYRSIGHSVRPVTE